MAKKRGRNKDDMRAVMSEMQTGKMQMRIHEPELPEMPMLSSFMAKPEKYRGDK